MVNSRQYNCTDQTSPTQFIVPTGPWRHRHHHHCHAPGSIVHSAATTCHRTSVQELVANAKAPSTKRHLRHCALARKRRPYHDHGRSVASSSSSSSLSSLSSSSLPSPPSSPPSCDLFDCCVFVCHRVLSPSSSGDGHPANCIRHRRRCCGHCCHRCCRDHRCCRRRHHRRRCHLTPPPHNLFDCCLCVLIPGRVVSL